MIELTSSDLDTILDYLDYCRDNYYITSVEIKQQILNPCGDIGAKSEEYILTMKTEE